MVFVGSFDTAADIAGVRFLYSEAPISILQEKKRKIADCLVKIGKSILALL